MLPRAKTPTEAAQAFGTTIHTRIGRIATTTHGVKVAGLLGARATMESGNEP